MVESITTDKNLTLEQGIKDNLNQNRELNRASGKVSFWQNLSKQYEDIKLKFTKSYTAIKDIGGNISQLYNKIGDSTIPLTEKLYEAIFIPINLAKALVFFSLGALETTNTLSAVYKDIVSFALDKADSLIKQQDWFDSAESLQTNITNITGIKIDQDLADTIIAGYKLTCAIDGTKNVTSALISGSYSMTDALNLIGGLSNVNTTMDYIYNTKQEVTSNLNDITYDNPHINQIEDIALTGLGSNVGIFI